MAEATSGELKTEEQIKGMIQSMERTLYARTYEPHFVASTFDKIKALKWVLGEIEYL